MVSRGGHHIAGGQPGAGRRWCSAGRDVGVCARDRRGDVARGDVGGGAGSPGRRPRGARTPGRHGGGAAPRRQPSAGPEMIDEGKLTANRIGERSFALVRAEVEATCSARGIRKLGIPGMTRRIPTWAPLKGGRIRVQSHRHPRIVGKFGPLAGARCVRTFCSQAARKQVNRGTSRYHIDWGCVGRIGRSRQIGSVGNPRVSAAGCVETPPGAGLLRHAAKRGSPTRSEGSNPSVSD